jgi:hypothetical protein
MLRLLRTPLCLTLVAGALLPASASAQTQIPGEPCEAWTPCTQVSGPWTTPYPGSGDLTTLNCPSDMFAVGADAEFPPNAAIFPVLVQVGGSSGLGFNSVTFALPVYTQSVTFQPWVGCSPPGQVTLQPSGPTPMQFRGHGDGAAAPYRAHVRSRRIRPGRHVGVAVGCGRGERLVRSGSAMQFFTRRAPSRRVVDALAYRQRRTGSVTRADVTAPRGVAAHERVELQVTTICSW